MGKYYCCMPQCSNYKSKVGKFGRPVTLHKIPKTDITRRQLWIRAISRKNWTPTDYTRVCSDHFEDGTGPTYLDPKNPTENLAQKRHSQIRPKRKQPFDRTRNAATVTVSTPVEKEEVGLHSVCDQEDIAIVHSYSKQTTTTEAQSAVEVGGVSAQTEGALSQDEEVTARRPEITIEDIEKSDELIQFYTGLQNRETFFALLTTLIEFGVEGNETGPKPKLRTVDEFLLVLMRLRLGLLLKDLSYRFKISDSTVSRIFNRWVSFMKVAMESLVQLPPLTDLQSIYIPQCFAEFSDTRIVLDCTEIFVQTPSSLENQCQTFSHYKSHNTFKALVGVSMTGAVVFVPKLWGGSTSDVEITRNCGLFDLLQPGDAVMVDKGFIHIKKDLERLGCKLYCPPFKSERQFSKAEVEKTRRIASARIHVERKMEQIKNFRLLQGVMPISVSHVADDIFFVCAALTNLLPPLVKE